MPFTIICQDITKMQVDAVVNAANKKLAAGGGVCDSIFEQAGAEKLQSFCKNLSPVETGHAVITPGFDLSAKYIIHAVGPVYNIFTGEKNKELLYSAYYESLKLALENKCESIAFPLISSGIYGYPKEEALSVAVSAIRDFLQKHDMDVYLAVFDKKAFSISKQLLGKVDSYISENYVDIHNDLHRKLITRNSEASFKKLSSRKEVSSYEEASFCEEEYVNSISDFSSSLDEIVDNLDEPFNTTLLRLIDAKGRTDTEVYKRANINRKLFSKIRTGNGYMPGKRTVIALAIALELTLDETDSLLEKAGYALSHSQKFDVIIEYFIINGRYDIFEINEVLFKYDQPLLGAS